MRPLITNTLGERQWLYVVRRVGEDRALAVIPQLGNRKPYPLNIARFLKIDLPSEEFLPLPEKDKSKRNAVARRELDNIKAILRQK